MDYAFHPVCEMFPLADKGEQFDAFVQSIATEGLKRPILLFEELIIDGRRRYLACKQLKIEPAVEIWDGKGSLAALVAALNFHLRHLTDGQRLYAALQLEKLIAEEMRLKQVSRLKRGTEIPVLATVPKREDSPKMRISTSGASAALSLPAERNGSQIASMGARDLSAQATGAKSRNIGKLKLIEAHDPQLAIAVRDDRITPARALRQVQNDQRQAKLEERAAAAGAAAAGAAAAYELIAADCVAHLGRLPARQFRLAIADPPYNEGIDYGSGKKADLMSEVEYLEFSRAWIEEVFRTLTPDGALWLIISSRWGYRLARVAEIAGFHIRSWCTWFETFGLNCANNFTKSSRPLLHLVKNKNDFLFHREPFTRRSWRQDNGDTRADPHGRLWDDVWGAGDNPPIPRLVGNAKERVSDFPTQLPLALVKPMVLGCSEPGDKILDPFNGSGTSGAAVIAAGGHRTYLGIDKNQTYIDLARLRLDAQQCEPFTPFSGVSDEHEKQRSAPPQASSPPRAKTAHAIPQRASHRTTKAPAAGARRPADRRRGRASVG